MTLTDLSAVAVMAKARGITTLTDNTFATPLNQRPLDLGIDLVFHSATKYFGGHSDLIAGVVMGSAEWIAKIWNTHVILGTALGPFDAWLMLRGLRTYLPSSTIVVASHDPLPLTADVSLVLVGAFSSRSS